ncbi:hypothetical protein HOC35_07275 [Candidatus Woesearchaeota archaeon]|jgi:hypothetical protein|nr:hypothetical protein [Candidatus Woesearchaeota archaeon]
MARFEYVNNLLYAFMAHPTGVTRPDVFLGTFSKFELSQYQKLLFDVLKKDEGFKRTPFQVVFPEQNAGLIKKLSDSDKQTYSLDESVDEAHIRFYLNGAISCELEPNRYHVEHYHGSHLDGSEYLENLVANNESLTTHDKENIISQIEFRDYGETCIADEENPHYVQHTKKRGLVLGFGAFCVMGRYSEIFEPLLGIGAFALFVGTAAYDRRNQQNNEVEQ